MDEKQINEIIQKEKLDTNLISDGYHTFKELYDHRIALFITLCNFIALPTKRFKKAQGKQIPWKSLKHSDGSEWDGWFIAGIGFEKGEQLTYHLPIQEWDKLKVNEWEKAPEYDGHTPNDVIERLLSLTNNT